MDDVFNQIIQFLDSHKLHRTASLMREELVDKNITQVHEKSMANSIKRAISKENFENKENNLNGEVVLENLMTRMIDSEQFTKTDNDKVQIQSLMKIKAFQNIVKSADQLFLTPTPEEKPLTAREIFTPTPEPTPLAFTPTPEPKVFATEESIENLPCFGSANANEDNLDFTPTQGLKKLPTSY